jgi:hypothetical protein
MSVYQFPSHANRGLSRRWVRIASGDDGRKLFQHVGHRGPVYKGLGAMNSCDHLRDRLRPGPGVFGVQPSAKTEASRFTILPEAALGSVASERYRWLSIPYKFGTGVNLAT